MPFCVVAAKPTAAVLDGFLPAAMRLGLDVRLLTDRPRAWPAPWSAQAEYCDVWDFRALIRSASRASAMFTNSDHLQVQVALAAHYLGLPGKDWRSALRAKDKLLMRRHLAAAGVEHVAAAELGPARAAAEPGSAGDQDVTFPAVVKPADGVASEDVVLVRDAASLERARAEIAARRGPGARLIAEQYQPGQLRTLETIGDGLTRWTLGGFRTQLSEPPYFIEDRLDWDPLPPGPVRAHVERALDALGAGFGACHTEFACTPDGPRLIEVNDRLIGDRCEFLLRDVLGLDVFELTLRVHLGERLPARIPPHPRAHGVAAYFRAQRPGLLVSAPPAGAVGCGAPGVRLRYWPLAPLGTQVRVENSNRDYLGVLIAVGTDADGVDRSVAALRDSTGWDTSGWVRP